MKEFMTADIEKTDFNPFVRIGKDWALLTAGDQENGWNTMTVSWGSVGVIWNKNVVTVYVRPQRYTLAFLEKSEHFSLSFFSAEYKNALTVCGSKSGRNIDKASETGLRPVVTASGVWFEQANTVFLCKKLFAQQLDPTGFIDPSIATNYPGKDYHIIFIGSINKLLIS
jgi:flavin reductase (DIM6/NTAB) family NADH-FMN oxidoreductase RutF